MPYVERTAVFMFGDLVRRESGEQAYFCWRLEDGLHVMPPNVGARAKVWPAKCELFMVRPWVERYGS
jgi:hypothetical protein